MSLQINLDFLHAAPPRTAGALFVFFRPCPLKHPGSKFPLTLFMHFFFVNRSFSLKHTRSLFKADLFLQPERNIYSSVCRPSFFLAHLLLLPFRKHNYPPSPPRAALLQGIQADNGTFLHSLAASIFQMSLICEALTSNTAATPGYG